MSSEVSGNVIDICALTSKPFAFTARSWELKNTESIDVSDAVMRILPRLNEFLASMRNLMKSGYQTRHVCYDGLKRQRLSEPMIRNANGRLEPASWYNALKAVASAIAKTSPDQMAGIAGKLADAESMMALNDLLNKLGSENLRCEGDGLLPTADIRSDYLMNTTIYGLEKADVSLLIGTQVCFLKVYLQSMAASTASHARYGAGHGNAEKMVHDTAIKCVHEGGNDNGNKSRCVVVEDSTHAVAEGDEWWDVEESCSTPKSAECRFPVDACLVCPPAPRKRKAVAARFNDASPTSALSHGSPPVMILPCFIDAFFTSAERGSF